MAWFTLIFGMIALVIGILLMLEAAKTQPPTVKSDRIAIYGLLGAAVGLLAAIISSAVLVVGLFH